MKEEWKEAGKSFGYAALAYVLAVILGRIFDGIGLRSMAGLARLLLKGCAVYFLWLAFKALVD